MQATMSTDSPVDPIHVDWPTLDALCVRYIARVLARTGGNKTRAARVLGVNPRTMRRITVTLARGRTPTINTGHNKRGAR
jgi:DNA-binding NtrC family response regulator